MSPSAFCTPHSAFCTLHSPLRASVVILLLVTLAASARSAEDDDEQAARDETIVETVLRLDGFDLDSSEKAKAAVLRYLGRHRGEDRYFELIERFKLADAADDLTELALAQPNDTAGVRAARLLASFGRLEKLSAKLAGDDPKMAVAAAQVLGFVGNEKALAVLCGLLDASDAPLEVRAAAVRGLGRSRPGEEKLLDLVEAEKLADDLKFTAANVLLASREAQIKERAGKHLSLPETRGEPLPPVAELVVRRGNPAAGEAIYRTKGTCLNCHQIGGEGKEVGPALTEIGGKLSREAMYTAILDPNAGISHNYETWEVITADGKIETGMLISRTDDSVTIKNAEAIEQTFAADDVDELTKLKTSLMPGDLQKDLTVEELVDLVEYLMKLRGDGGKG